MAKKKKRRNKKSRAPEKVLTIAELEAQAAESFNVGNFRQAISAAQRLCDRDRERYEPLLRRARLALVKVLLDKGKVSSARAAFTPLTKMPLVPEIDVLSLRLARESGDFAAAAEAAARLLTAEAQVDDDRRHQLWAADTLVLSFADFPPSRAADHPGPAAELARVHQALALICAQSYDEARAAVDKVNRRSLFAHWRLFIKGLVAFYRHEDDKAGQAFRRLPADSWLVGAASPFQLLLLPAADSRCRQLAKDEARLRDACLLAGRPELAAVLPRANYLWMTGRHRDSFRFLRRSWAGFPAETPDAYGSLTRFYYNSGFHLEGEPRDRYLHFLHDLSRNEKEKNETVVLQGLRLTALYCEDCWGEETEAVFYWQEFRRRYQHFYGENPLLNSLVYARLGELFAQEPPGMEMNPFQLPGFPDGKAGKKKILDPEMAEKYFLLSIKADDGNKKAWLDLLAVYAGVGWKSKQNRLLDDMVKCFPDDKDVLLQAGSGCWERGALYKGWKYFCRALDLDPLDSVTQEKCILLTIDRARGQVRKGRWEKCRSLLAEVENITRPELDDFNRGRSYFLGRWSIFSLLADKKEEARDYYQRAVEQAPNVDKFLYFYRLYASIQGCDRRSFPWAQKVSRKLFPGVSVATAMDCLDVFQYCRLLPAADDARLLEKEEKQLQKVLAKVMPRADAGQVVTVLEYLLPGSLVDKRLVRACLRRLRILDAGSPHYLYYRFVVEKQGAQKLPREEDLVRLREILAVAEKRRERQLADRIKELITRLEPFFDLLAEMKDRYDEDGTDLEDEDFFGDDPGGDGGEHWDMPLPPGASAPPPSWNTSRGPARDSRKQRKDSAAQEAGALLEAASLFDLLDD